MTVRRGLVSPRNSEAARIGACELERRCSEVARVCAHESECDAELGLSSSGAGRV